MSKNPWDRSPLEVLRAGPGFDLASFDPSSTPGWSDDKDEGTERMLEQGARLADLQEMLFAEGRSDGTRSVLLVLQGMDTAGKGGIVRHVVGMVDPQGVDHASFGKPTEEELAHHYLWRIRNALPAPGPARRVRPLALRGRARGARGEPGAARRLGRALRRDQRVRGRAGRVGHLRGQGRADGLPRRAARSPARAPRAPRQALEVQPRGPRGTRQVARLPRGVPGRAGPHVDRDRALVRRPGGPQVVRPPGGHRAPRRRLRTPRPALARRGLRRRQPSWPASTPPNPPT